MLTLALGIGANTAIFSVVYGVLLRPLPYRDAARSDGDERDDAEGWHVSVSYPNFLDWRAQSHAFSQMAAVRRGFNLAASISRKISAAWRFRRISFRCWACARCWAATSMRRRKKPGRRPWCCELSLWQSHLGGDPNAVGRTITLDGRGFTIIGVLPPDFDRR